MTERPNVPVLKTGVGLPTVGSNPTPSAICGVPWWVDHGYATLQCNEEAFLGLVHRDGAVYRKHARA